MSWFLEKALREVGVVFRWMVGDGSWIMDVPFGAIGEAAMKDLFGDVFLIIKDKDASIAWYLGTLES